MLFSIFAAEGPNGRQIAADINEVIWGSLAFFVLVALIAWKAGPAIKGMINGRTERIRNELESAKAERSEAEASLSASQAELPDISAEESRIRAEASETAERLKVDLVNKANADAEALKARANADVENMKRQALADLRSDVAGLTRDAAEAVVNESLDDTAHSELIDTYINQVGS